MPPPRGRQPRPPRRDPHETAARPPTGPRERGLGGEQVEGLHAVRELLLARKRRVRDIWMSDIADRDTPEVAAILDLAREAKVPIREVSRGRLDAEAGTRAPQGVLAHAAPLKEYDLDELIARRRGRDGEAPFLLVVEGVSDPGNLGALLRAADGAGVTGVVLPRHRAVHVTPAATKAAAGAIEHVPMAVVPGIPAALQALGKAGVWTIGLDGDVDQSVFEIDLATEPVALVVGSEGAGLTRLARQRCDLLASIPQRGGLPSLNVAAAAAVACYEVARRRLASRS